MQKIKWTLSGVIIFSSVIMILNALMIFLFIVFFYLDKGNIVSILFAEKIIILDISIVCAIGKTLNWPVFKYLTKLKVESNDGDIQRNNQNKNTHH